MITRELLVALRTDLTQVVYAWLSEREIKAYALFADADMENLHRNSLYGREEMMEYAGVLVRKAVQYRQYINKSDSVTSQVCAYIDAHYREEKLWITERKNPVFVYRSRRMGNTAYCRKSRRRARD